MITPARSALVADVAALGCGLLFAVGLGVAGMTDPRKVIGFLDVAGAWDPSLMLVMAAAIAVHLPFLRWWEHRGMTPARRRAAPASWPAVIDRPLLAGATLFGVGWGLVGYCPGPGFVAVATGGAGALTFAITMLLGMSLYVRSRRRMV